MTKFDVDGVPASGCGRVGAWFVGARGSVAVTATMGLHALAAGLMSPTGVTTAGPEFAGAALPAFSDIVVGGHDIAPESIVKRAEQLSGAALFSNQLVRAVADVLAATDQEICTLDDNGLSQQEQIDRRVADIIAFRRRHQLDRVVVVDVSSTEPLPNDRPEFHDEELLAAALKDPRQLVLPPSSLAAAAAIEAGCAYVCFTPSASLRVPVLRGRAAARGIPYAGQDGKTGQTLLRTVLAPMFTGRAMQVHSWAGANVLGGGDGATLADPEAVQSKLESKTRGLRDLVGQDVVAPLHIDNVPDLGETKTAWDHVHATGFMGSRIILQTIWSAHDSTLAAPLVIDLIRLMALAHANGEAGPVGAMAVFFKDPWGSTTHAFSEQRAELISWARSGRRLP